jgi:hypothetical protein
MAVADADMKFIFVDVGTNGRISDGGVWGKCALKHAIESDVLNIPKVKEVGQENMPCVFVGDEAFPLKTYIMKPYSVKSLNTERRIFNYRLSRARRVVENAFGILSAVWRVYRQPIALSVENTKKVVLATTILHNLLRSKSSVRNIYNPPDFIDREDISTGEIIPGLWRQELNCNAIQPLGRITTNFHSQEAKLIRDNFSKYFSDKGKVSWQSKFSYTK